MKIGVPKELRSGETRVPLVPAGVEKLVKLGAKVEIESGLGETINLADQEYESVGASISGDRQALLSGSDVVLRVGKPPTEEIDWLKPECIHMSFLDPFNDLDLLQKLAQRGVSAVCMEMIPRTTKAQKMDALSSQANLAGYVAVILAAEACDKIFPMMTTPAGTIAPARVFIIGAGVAGLQAIATAKRLGARVEAFDTRPVVEEQVRSLGARFVKIDIGETGETREGYAKALTEEQLEKQRQGMARICAQSDVVISTAQVFGRKAPLIVTGDMVSQMKPGSVIVDLAVETGGNVEGSEAGKVIQKRGVTIIGYGNWPGRVPVHASQVYSSNLVNLISEFWNKEKGCLELSLDDEILQSCLVTHAGAITNERLSGLVKA